MGTKVCRRCSKEFEDDFRAWYCVDCKLSPPPRKRTDLATGIAKKLWREFVDKHDLMWWTRHVGGKEQKWAGKGYAGWVQVADQAVPIGFFRRKQGAWVTVKFKDGQVVFEPRCFATWCTPAGHPKPKYNHNLLIQGWQKAGDCECGACIAARELDKIAAGSTLLVGDPDEQS